MKIETSVSNTTTPNSSRKKTLWAISLILSLILLVLIPLYSVKRYAELLKTQSSPPEIQSRAECGVVLTGAAGRIREGISLLSHGFIQKLIISGVHQHSTLQDMFPEILFYPEIKLENVVLERRSNSTASNAQSSLPIVEALHCQSILLITSDYHMFRALKTFNQLFPGGIKIIPNPIRSDRFQLREHLAFDSRYWGTVFEEWYKYIFYEAFVFTAT